MSFDLYLASQSPRRKELLESMGLQLKCCPADIDETASAGESPQNYVQRLALEKAKTAYANISKPVKNIPCLGADTIVACNGELFGKPKNKQDAQRMWHAMSASQHQVLTAIAVVCEVLNEGSNELREQTALSLNQVSFKKVTDDEMDIYWQSGEPQDKAGAYGIQGRASAWIESIQGSYTGIMGLPLYETNEALKHYGLNWL